MADKTISTRPSTLPPDQILLPRERVRVVDMETVEGARGDAAVTSDSLKDFGEGSPLIMIFVEQDGEQHVVLHTLTQERSSPHNNEEPGQLSAESSSFHLLNADVSVQPDAANTRQIDAADPFTSADEQRERQLVAFYELDA